MTDAKPTDLAQLSRAAAAAIRASRFPVTDDLVLREHHDALWASALDKVRQLEDEKALWVHGEGRAFTLAQRVRKKSGSSWQGRIVGFYSTELTPVGYAVESEREPGSVQIYPEAALEAVL